MAHPTSNSVKGLITLALLTLQAGVLWLIASEGSDTSNLEALWAHPAREGPIVPECVAVCDALHAGLVLESETEAGGTRLKGELFHDESVQKILSAGGVLGQFTHLIRSPRT